MVCGRIRVIGGFVSLGKEKLVLAIGDYWEDGSVDGAIEVYQTGSGMPFSLKDGTVLYYATLGSWPLFVIDAQAI